MILSSDFDRFGTFAIWAIGFGYIGFFLIQCLHGLLFIKMTAELNLKIRSGRTELQFHSL